VLIAAAHSIYNGWSGLKSRRVWRSSESLASWLLEDLGFSVLEFNKRISIGGLEVGEVDMVAEKDGALYAVEVKAGKADTASVKQAFVNASLLKAKPLVVARGADDKALALAKELGVEVIVLPDLLVAGSDELRSIVVEAVVDSMLWLATLLTSCSRLEPGDERVLQAIASSDTFKEAAEALGVSPEDLARRLASIKGRGVPLETSRPFKFLKLQALAYILCLSMQRLPPIGRRDRPLIE